MFLRYIAQQSLPVNVEFGSSTESKTFTHSNSQDIISGYKDSDKINLASGVQISDTNISGNDLFVSSNIGTIILRTKTEMFKITDYLQIGRARLISELAMKILLFTVLIILIMIFGQEMAAHYFGAVLTATIILLAAMALMNLLQVLAAATTPFLKLKAET